MKLEIGPRFGRYDCGGKNGDTVLCRYPRLCWQRDWVRNLGDFDRYWVDEAYAVKSALPDVALEVSLEILLLQTAPLWPIKVPTQSPVHSLSIGLPSLQLDINR